MYADLMDSIGFVAGYDKEVGDAMNAEALPASAAILN